MDHTIFNERPECQDRIIELLKRMGWQYISRSEAEEKRGKLTNVLFEDELVRFLKRQTYTANNQEFNFSGESIATAVKRLNVPLVGGLLPTSNEIYNYLTLGTDVVEKVLISGADYRNQSVDLHYIDFKHFDENIFQVTEEFSVEKLNGEHCRPDIVLMVNGIPLVVIECKKSAVDVSTGVKQNCQNMLPDHIPELFKFSQIVLALNPNKAKYGTCGTDEKWFAEWKEDLQSNPEFNEWQNKYNAKPNSVQDSVTLSLFERKRFLNLIENYIIYDNGIKKIARYQQFFAIENTIKRLEKKDGGVIWHTQGSGKSLTMIMLVKRIMTEYALLSPRFVIITDRIDLDKQLTENFAHTGLEPKRATTGSGLVELLKGQSTVITTIINKFETAVKNRYINPSSDNIFVLIDEAHRSNYGMRFNEMKEVLPNAKMVAFTGTPLIAKQDKQTVKQFGSLIHTYTMRNGITDNVIVPLVYGSRVVRQNVENETMLDDLFNDITKDATEEYKEELKSMFSTHKRLAELHGRIFLIACDIKKDFEKTCKPMGLKAMVACSSRAAAVEMYNCLKTFEPTIRPIVSISFNDREGEDDDDTDSALKKIAEYHKEVVKKKFGSNDEKYYEHILNEFTSGNEDTYNILIVKDKHLTGFDAPIVGTLYLDKSIQEHNVLQAIARVNRIYKTKDVGIIVDYYGVLKKLNEAMNMYDEAEENVNLDKENFATAIYSIQEMSLQLERNYQELISMFAACKTAEEFAEVLRDSPTRGDFNNKLKDFEKSLLLAMSNRELFVTVGFGKIEKYKKEWLFYKKLQASVKQRFEVDEIDDSGNIIIREDAMLNLLNNYVRANEVKEILKPFSITDEAQMRQALKEIGISKRAQADLIKTKVESKLKQIRYNDPLLHEEFSKKIKKTIYDYENSRNEDVYLADIRRIADDFKNGFEKQSYPTSIKDDSEAKSVYGSILKEIQNNKVATTLPQEEIVASVSMDIKKMLTSKTKKDWKHNEVVHKEIRCSLDDYLFDMFASIGVEITEDNVVMLDLIIDEIMKIAIMGF
jgi:type I restriction enzyme R subunit